jgi:phenylacetate-CoA ligase
MNKFSLLISDLLKSQNTYYYLKHFENLINTSREKIEEYQFQKLKNLLIHCEKNVPFYKKRFHENHFSVSNFSRSEQMKDIPPLTRTDLQNSWRDIIAENYNEKKLSVGSSSGSTGFPVFYRKDNNAVSAGQAAHLLGWSLSGWKMSMKGLHIWGNPSTVNIEWKKLSSRLKAKVFRHHKFPAYRLTDSSKLFELYQLINKNKYEYIDGYTNAIYSFADFLRAKNLSLKHQVKYVLTTAENLQDFQRKIIEENIGPIYDTYGCSEINGIAYECHRCKTYHIMDPHVYVEFSYQVDTFGSCELLITDLDNFAFPLVRYKNEDLGIPVIENEIGCEVKFSRMAKISGRESDLIKLKDGGILSVPSFFGSMLLKNISGLKQYQIEKIEDDLIHINLIKTSEFSPKDLTIIESALKEYINDKIKYEIRFVDDIEVSQTGKFKLLIDKTKNK